MFVEERNSPNANHTKNMSSFFDEGTSEEEDEPTVFLPGMALLVASGLVFLPLAVLARI